MTTKQEIMTKLLAAGYEIKLLPVGEFWLAGRGLISYAVAKKLADKAIVLNREAVPA